MREGVATFWKRTPMPATLLSLAATCWCESPRRRTISTRWKGAITTGVGGMCAEARGRRMPRVTRALGGPTILRTTAEMSSPLIGSPSTVCSRSPNSSSPAGGNSCLSSELGASKNVMRHIRQYTITAECGSTIGRNVSNHGKRAVRNELSKTEISAWSAPKQRGG